MAIVENLMAITVALWPSHGHNGHYLPRAEDDVDAFLGGAAQFNVHCSYSKYARVRSLREFDHHTTIIS